MSAVVVRFEYKTVLDAGFGTPQYPQGIFLVAIMDVTNHGLVSGEVGYYSSFRVQDSLGTPAARGSQRGNAWKGSGSVVALRLFAEKRGCSCHEREAGADVQLLSQGRHLSSCALQAGHFDSAHF